jgi:hypothetical protein
LKLNEFWPPQLFLKTCIYCRTDELIQANSLVYESKFSGQKNFFASLSYEFFRSKIFFCKLWVLWNFQVNEISLRVWVQWLKSVRWTNKTWTTTTRSPESPGFSSYWFLLFHIYYQVLFHCIAVSVIIWLMWSNLLKNLLTANLFVFYFIFWRNELSHTAFLWFLKRKSN